MTRSEHPIRWLVTGAGGMLGQDVVARLHAAGAAHTALHRAELDITDPAAVKAAVQGHDIVVNTAAWTNVDGAETDEAAAMAVNGEGTRNVAIACAAAGAHLLHLSTDYVFDGASATPYPEDAPTGPINVYGRSKLVGEHAVRDLLPDTGYVVRTAWMYGAGGRNFARTMLRLAASRDTVDVVNDQFGQPTWSFALAGRLLQLGGAALAGTAPPGTYHGTATGETTWFGFARAVFAAAGLDPDRVRPTTSEKFVLPARRPAYSVLGHDRWAAAGLPPLPDWHSLVTLASAGPGLLVSDQT